jgi:hypothetical protein
MGKRKVTQTSWFIPDAGKRLTLDGIGNHQRTGGRLVTVRDRDADPIGIHHPGQVIRIRRVKRNRNR